jgi:uroporphyrinogen decarboxylase
MPRLKKIVEVYHGKGLKVIFHSDGNLWDIMDDLVDCGIDALNPIESFAGMDIEKLRKRYPKLVLIGGIDCSELLPFGSPYGVRCTVKKAIEDSKYGYFVGSSSELHNEIPLVNILAMYTEVLRYLERITN